ncbi:MAG: Trk system potassium transporter TrkA [Lachnospiraceae bacterium]|nr:Trk system potassium transporter TrkA [Lachnospiraceae bacterium]
MNIIIVGCGKIGVSIAKQLREENHDIVVVDKNQDKIDEATSSFDIMGIVGNGTDYNILEEAGVDTANLLIAVTGSDELNLLCCVLAMQNDNCHTIARVREPLYSRQYDLLKKRLGISMLINPELASADEMAKILRYPTAIKVETFAKGKVELLNFKVTEDQVIDNMQIMDIHNILKCNIMVCAIERGNEIIIASGTTIIRRGDIVYFLASGKDTTRFFKKIGIKSKHVKNVLVAGGGKIAFYLSKKLVESGSINVHIMEKDRERCEFLSTYLPQAVIVNGDASDFDQLLGEGIQNADGFVALTNIDEENVFLALLAKKHSNAKVISKVNRLTIENMAEDLDAGSIISPTYTAANYIIKHVRAMNNTLNSNVETLYKIIDGNAEALEFNIRDDSEVVGVPIKSLKLKPQLLICMISRGNENFIPFGDSVIEEGDSVIVVTTQKGLDCIDDIIDR